VTARPTEIKALAEILKEDHEFETVEACAKALIERLDDERASRLSYFGVLQFGSPGQHISLGFGPYVSQKAAGKALATHPARDLAVASVVVPVQSEEGVQQALAKLDLPPEPYTVNTKEAQKRDREFWGKVSKIKDKEVTAISGDVKIKALRLPK